MSIPRFRVPSLRRALGAVFLAAVVLLISQYKSIARWRRIPKGFPRDHRPFPKPDFRPGVAKPPGSNYSRTLITPRLMEENVDWMDQELPELDKAIYIVDNPKAALHPPKNKGHEVMVYLSYIIDNYDDLPDIMMFMHSHRFAWHNEEPLDMDAVQLVRRLSSERVFREGFVNMRCSWVPGCPDWIHPNSKTEDIQKQEEPMVARAWTELFPYEPVPETLAQPCCAQFALSRDRVLSIPKSRYIYYRDWLLLTDISDYISGRVWEYLWQVVFAGQSIFCPAQNVCYCDSYGLCFGGPEGFERYSDLYQEIQDQQKELKAWRDKTKEIEEAAAAGKTKELEKLEPPEPGRDVWLEGEINRKINDLFNMKVEALKRGGSAENRAKEAGRPWKPGDGF